MMAERRLYSFYLIKFIDHMASCIIGYYFILVTWCTYGTWHCRLHSNSFVDIRQILCVFHCSIRHNNVCFLHRFYHYKNSLCLLCFSSPNASSLSWARVRHASCRVFMKDAETAFVSKAQVIIYFCEMHYVFPCLHMQYTAIQKC